MSNHRKPWEPDPTQVGNNWTSMFERQGRDVKPAPSASAPTEAHVTAESPAVDLTEYRPWKLQRGNSRPALMLALRRFERKSGLWRGWAMPYPSLYAVEHMGDRMINLDFGARQFTVEGRGLDVLADYMQQGVVLNVVEYDASIWSTAESAIVTAIRCAGLDGNS